MFRPTPMPSSDFTKFKEIKYCLCVADVEISTSATHKQYLVSLNFVKPDDGIRVGRNMSFH